MGLGLPRGTKRDRAKPVFKRVLGCFERPVDLAAALGETRTVIDYWLTLGYVPPSRAIEVAQAVAAAGGKVTAMEILHEANRENARKRVAREERKRREIEARDADVARQEGGAQ